MRSRTRVIAAAAVAAALAAGGADAAMASTTGTKPGAPPKTVSASAKSAGGTDLGGDLRGSKAALANAGPQPGADALPAAVAGELHVSAARATTAVRPLLAGGMIDSSSQEFAAAARSLGVSPQQLSAALAQAKQSLGGGK